MAKRKREQTTVACPNPDHDEQQLLEVAGDYELASTGDGVPGADVRHRKLECPACGYVAMQGEAAP